MQSADVAHQLLTTHLSTEYVHVSPRSDCRSRSKTERLCGHLLTFIPLWGVVLHVLPVSDEFLDHPSGRDQGFEAKIGGQAIHRQHVVAIGEREDEIIQVDR